MYLIVYRKCYTNLLRFYPKRLGCEMPFLNNVMLPYSMNNEYTYNRLRNLTMQCLYKKVSSFFCVCLILLLLFVFASNKIDAIIAKKDRPNKEILFEDGVQRTRANTSKRSYFDLLLNLPCANFYYAAFLRRKL